MVKQEVSKAFTCLRCYLGKCSDVWIHKKMPPKSLAWEPLWEVKFWGMNFQGCLKLFVSNMFSSSLRSLCGWSIWLCQGRELAFRYLHCKGSLFCSSGRTWLPNSHGELGMTFCRKPLTDYPENGRAKFQTHFKPRDFEPTGIPYLSKRIHKPSGHSEVSETMQSMAVQPHG